ncbi:MAG: IS110 family transposase [Actinomycetota bacterium]|nr:IS110 family transposase [Actinomycetota bacterium]
MLHLGLDLSRKRLDTCLMNDEGTVVETGQEGVTGDALGRFADRLTSMDQPVRGVIESMTGARFVHDTLEDFGVDVEIADAAKVKGFAPVTAKTDRIDAAVLADLSRRDLIPAIWLPDPQTRSVRELVRFRIKLVKLRTMLKNRIHSTLMTHGIPNPTSDLFGATGRRLLDELEIPDPWAMNTIETIALIEILDQRIAAYRLRIIEQGARYRYVDQLVTIPGVGPILGLTIAAEIGDIERFDTPKRFVSYTGLAPRVYQSGETDRRGPLTKHGPRLLRWALIEATTHAARHPAYRNHHNDIRRRLGPQRGPKIARIDVARRIATATWWMCTRNESFAPQGPCPPLVA